MSPFQVAAPAEHVVRRLSSCRMIFAASVIAGAAAALILKDLHLGPPIAVAFLLCGVSLWLGDEDAGSGRRAVYSVLGFTVFAAGLFRVAEYCLDLRLGAISAQGVPPNTTLNFILLGLALALPDREIGRHRPAQYLAFLASFVSMLAFVGHVYRVQTFTRMVLPSLPMGAFTSLLFMLLCAGTFCARPSAGFMSVLASRGSGGIMSRRLLPAAVILPLVIGWGGLYGATQRWYSVDAGFAVLAVCHVLLFGALIWRNARSLYWLDIDRSNAEAALREVHADLEARIEKRTQELGRANLDLKAEINERRKVEKQLLHSALYDPLTGLPNRLLVMERLGQALLQSKRDPEHLFAVLFLDIDRFKAVNDSLGHGIADQYLVLMAQRLVGLLRLVDTVARLGGDEFAIVLYKVRDAAEATHFADRIQRELSKPFLVGGQELQCTVSIGIALNQRGSGELAEDLLRDADMAMYRAKSQGKARCEVFDVAMHHQAMATLKLETDLRRAIDKGELLVVFQPFFSLRENRIIGCEALVRWIHPELGFLYPAHFIALAEDTGLILPLGEWVLRAACRQSRAWRDAGLPPIDISVNISPRQLLPDNLSRVVAQVLDETGIPPRSLHLELTETSIMENVHQSARILRQLKETGVRLAVDDFGTGYSSLMQLKRFPFDSLKIDRSFIHEVTINEEDASITRAMILLGHTLKLEIIAEGVETLEQLQFLRANACDQVQGFLFGQALSGGEFGELLRNPPKMPGTR